MPNALQQFHRSFTENYLILHVAAEWGILGVQRDNATIQGIQEFDWINIGHLAPEQVDLKNYVGGNQLSEGN